MTSKNVLSSTRQRIENDLLANRQCLIYKLRAKDNVSRLIADAAASLCENRSYVMVFPQMYEQQGLIEQMEQQAGYLSTDVDKIFSLSFENDYVTLSEFQNWLTYGELPSQKDMYDFLTIPGFKTMYGDECSTSIVKHRNPCFPDDVLWTPKFPLECKFDMRGNRSLYIRIQAENYVRNWTPKDDPTKVLSIPFSLPPLKARLGNLMHELHDSTLCIQISLHSVRYWVSSIGLDFGWKRVESQRK